MYYIPIPVGFKDYALKKAEKSPKYPVNKTLLGNLNAIKEMTDEETFNFLWMLGFKTYAMSIRDYLRKKSNKAQSITDPCESS